MLSTASALLEATQEGIIGDEQMELASFIVHSRHDLDQEQFSRAMFMYATAIASCVTDKVTKVLLSKDDLQALADTIDEMEIMRNEVLENGE